MDAGTGASASAMATTQKGATGMAKAIDLPEDPIPGVRYNFITYCNTILTYANNALLVRGSRLSTLA